MANINKCDIKTNENIEKLSFSRHSSQKKRSFEQSLASKDLTSFSTSCVGGKLYQLIQSSQNSVFSFESFNLHKTKNDIFREKLKQEPEYTESQLNLNFANLTFNHSVKNEQQEEEQQENSEIVMEDSEDIFSQNNSSENNISENNNSYNNDLVITTLIQNDKKCDLCTCSIF